MKILLIASLFIIPFISLHAQSWSWDQVIKKVAADREDSDVFGVSVSISGDKAIVGAPLEDEDRFGGNSKTNAGSAYIFELISGTWIQTAKLVAIDRGANDDFGRSVSISGNKVIIGAPLEDHNASGTTTLSDAGSAYIFEQIAGNWTQTKKLVASDREAGDNFGISVSISGDRVIIGASLENEDASGGNTLNHAGSAYIFELVSGTWTQTAKLVASDREETDWFGGSVSISDDKAIVSASAEDHDVSGGNTLDYSGSAYIFEKIAGTWTQTAKIVASDREEADRFGINVCISGNKVVVGAYVEDHDAFGLNTLSNAGSAYIFEFNGGTWTQTAKLVASDRSSNDYFGKSVSISGDKVIIGAHRDDHDGSGGNYESEAGSAYIFELIGSNWTEIDKIVASDRYEYDWFGWSVSISGDNAIVGAYAEDENSIGGNTLNAAGSAYIYKAVCSPIAPPVADVTILPDLTAECEVTNLTSPTATDQCGGIVIGSHNASLPITNLGTTTITWTYNDGNGNSSSQTQDIIITDVLAPISDMNSLSDIISNCGEAVTSLTAPTATDNCVGSITGTHNVVLPITSVGTTVVTWTYDDGNGNISSQTQNVIINDDVTDPIINIASLPDIISTCEQPVTSLTAPTATDNCTGSITGTHNVTLPITSIGTTIITWTYDDGNGNTTTQTQNVIINDDITEPVVNTISLPDIISTCGQPVTSLTAPTATDNCAGSITGTHNVMLPITSFGTTTITWTYDDGNGNSATQTQNIIINNDTTDPVANTSILNDINTECEITPIAPTATDNCSGLITGTPNVTFPITAIGTTAVIWTYDDGNGNTSSQTQNIIITPIDNGITQVNQITLAANASGYNYQWVDCNNSNSPISGATSQSFTPTVAGSYACEINNGTCTVTTACLTSTVGIIENSFGNPLVIYPNPTFGNLKVDLGGVYNRTTVKVYNSLGQVVIDKSLGLTNEINLIIEDSPGIYILEINTQEGKTARIKVIKE